MRAFCFQAAILTTLNALSMILLFPALLGLDLRRVSGKKIDILCCYKSICCYKSKNIKSSNNSSEKTNSKSEVGAKVIKVQDNFTSEMSSLNQKLKRNSKWTLKGLASQYYEFCVSKTLFKIATMISVVVLTGIGIYNLARMEQGFSRQEIIPDDTSAYNFVKASDKYFGFYHMYAGVYFPFKFQ